MDPPATNVARPADASVPQNQPLPAAVPRRRARAAPVTALPTPGHRPRDMRAAEERVLARTTVGSTSRQGVVHIPIEEAKTSCYRNDWRSPPAGAGGVHRRRPPGAGPHRRERPLPPQHRRSAPIVHLRESSRRGADAAGPAGGTRRSAALAFALVVLAASGAFAQTSSATPAAASRAGRHRPEAQHPDPARSRCSATRTARSCGSSEYFDHGQAGAAQLRLLPLPDALPDGPGRDDQRAHGAEVRHRQGVRRHHRQHRSARHGRRTPRRRRRNTSSATAGSTPRRAGTSSPRTRRAIKTLTEHGRLPVRVRRRHATSSRTARRCSCSRRTAASPATSTASSTSRAICAWRSSRPRRARSARPPTSSSCSAITTTRPPASTAAAP